MLKTSYSPDLTERLNDLMTRDPELVLHAELAMELWSAGQIDPDHVHTTRGTRYDVLLRRLARPYSRLRLAALRDRHGMKITATALDGRPIAAQVASAKALAVPGRGSWTPNPSWKG